VNNTDAEAPNPGLNCKLVPQIWLDDCRINKDVDQKHVLCEIRFTVTIGKSFEPLVADDGTAGHSSW